MLSNALLIKTARSKRKESATQARAVAVLRENQLVALQ
jgi:hypothetical protein